MRRCTSTGRINRAEAGDPGKTVDGVDTETSGEVSDYFAEARLTRQTSRDEALALLETAAAGEGASQETIDGAMDAIAAMATWSMQETQIENLLLAKNFEDCVVYISGDGVTAAVPAPGRGALRRERGADNRDDNRRDRLLRGGHTGHRGQEGHGGEVRRPGRRARARRRSQSPAASPAAEK